MGNGRHEILTKAVRGVIRMYCRLPISPVYWFETVYRRVMPGLTLRFAQFFLLTLPFQFALAPVAGIDLPFSRVLTPIMFAFWLAYSLARRDLRLPSGVLAISLLLFLVFNVFPIPFSERPDWAVRRVSFLLSYLPLFPVFFFLAREYGSEGVRMMLVPFVAGAGVAGFIGLFQFSSQFVLGTAPAFHLWTDSILPFFLGPGFAAAVSEYPSLLVNIGGMTILRASAFFPDPHIMGFYMGLALPAAYALFRSTTLPSSRAVWGTVFVTIAIADLLTFSRGAYVGLFTGGLTVFFLVPSSEYGAGRKALSVIATISILFLVFAFDNPVSDRFLSIFSREDGSNEGRVAMFIEAFDRINDRPFGYGPGNYPLAVKPTAEYREPIYAHDLFLDIATEGGIIAASAFLIAIVSGFVFLIRRSSRDIVPLSAAVSLGVFFGHALFETPLYSVHILPALMLFLALPAAYARIKA